MGQEIFSIFPPQIENFALCWCFLPLNLGKTMPARPAENAIMTIGEVADYLKVTERTIYRLAGNKQIPAFKVGGSWRFSKMDIDGWIKQQSSTADQPKA